MGKTKVLFIEDDLAHSEAIKRVLSSDGKYIFNAVDSVKGYYDFIAGETPDIVIADINVRDGKSTKILVSPPDQLSYPILILTSYGDEKTAVDAMKAGALDYMVKSPEIFADMPHMIERAMREWEYVIERKQAQIELKLNTLRMEAQLKLNQMNHSSVEEIADFALEEGVKLTGSKYGYLAFLNDDETKLNIYNWSNNAVKECSIKEWEREYLVKDTGLWGESIRQRKPVITNNMSNSNDYKKGLPEGHLKLFNHLSIPIFSGDKIVALAGVSNKTGNYDNSDTTALTLLFESMWHLIQRKKAEEALAKEQSLLTGLITASPDYIYFKDVQGKFLLINEILARKFGLNNSYEAIGKSDFDFFRKSFAEQTLLDEQKIMSTGKAMINKEEKNDWPVDETAWVSTTKIPLRDNTEKIIGIMGISRDITERKKTEEELHKYRTELESLVKSRTEQLDETNLRLQDELNKQKEYELILKSTLEKERELNELKTRFISTTSHEFRTPLTTVLTSTDLMQRYGGNWPDEKRNIHINRIREAVRYLTKLLDDILTISRADSGKLLCEPHAIDLDSFCREILSDVKVHEKSNHVTEYNYSLEPGNYLLDKKLIKFMLSNLLSNAYKYSPEGGTIVLNVSGSESRIIFSVKDSGIGISDTEHPHIFEPFYRSGNVSGIPGTGLGLSIVKKAVEIHGGVIEFTSVAGKGTTFKIELPKTDVD